MTTKFVVIGRSSYSALPIDRWRIMKSERQTPQRFYVKAEKEGRWNDPYTRAAQVIAVFHTLEEATVFVEQAKLAVALEKAAYDAAEVEEARARETRLLAERALRDVTQQFLDRRK